MTRSERVLVAAGGGALLLAVAAAAVLLLPAEAAPADDAGSLLVPSQAAIADATPTPAPTPSIIVVDVAGAVARPGLIELEPGARVGDAIAAAGGYAPDADLDAATASLNLAQRLADGEQVRVPRLGDGTAPQPVAGGSAASDPTGSDGTSDGGLINLNTATPDELEALPGIGPVTVEKILAAREERPFMSLDDALQRGVIHRGQLEDIRDHATAG